MDSLQIEVVLCALQLLPWCPLPLSGQQYQSDLLPDLAQAAELRQSLKGQPSIHSPNTIPLAPITGVGALVGSRRHSGVLAEAVRLSDRLCCRLSSRRACRRTTPFSWRVRAARP